MLSKSSRAVSRHDSPRLATTARAMEAPQELVAALAAHGEALAAELRALDDMPQVKLTPASVFDRAKLPGSIAQKRGVICKLRCCGCQLDQKCNELTGDAACPTHVEAARRLRAKVAEQHGSAACLEKAEQKLAEEGSGSRGPVESAFSVMMAVHVYVLYVAFSHSFGAKLAQIFSRGAAPHPAQKTLNLHEPVGHAPMAGAQCPSSARRRTLAVRVLHLRSST